MAQPVTGDPGRKSPDQGGLPPRDRTGVGDVPGRASGAPGDDATPDGHEGATEDQVGDRTGPGVGYDQEPPKEPGDAGVS
jgi:hypothetical protein